MMIIGEEGKLFCELDTSLEQFVTKEKNKDVLYVQLDRALYGCVQSALLWYEVDEHEILGMDIQFKNKKVIVRMKKHTLKAINSFGGDIMRNASTTANPVFVKN